MGKKKSLEHSLYLLFFPSFSGQKNLSFSLFSEREKKKTTKHNFNDLHFCYFTVLSFLIFFLKKTSKTHKLLNTIEIWLILPVVICLFQGLSHACLRITAMQESAHGSLHQTQSAAKMLRKRIIGYLVRNAKLIHELKGSSRSTRRKLAESVVADPADE